MPHNALHGLGLVEVAQTGEEVGHKVKGAMPTALTVQLPQVVDLKLKPLVGRDKRMVDCRSDARFTQVEGVNVPSSLEKGPGMSPRPASSVQHASRACEAFLVEQGLDKLVGLLFASVAIEPVVRLRIEPRSEPFGVRFPHFSLQFLAHPATKVRHKIRSLTCTESDETNAIFFPSKPPQS